MAAAVARRGAGARARRGRGDRGVPRVAARRALHPARRPRVRDGGRARRAERAGQVGSGLGILRDDGTSRFALPSSLEDAARVPARAPDCERRSARDRQDQPRLARAPASPHGRRPVRVLRPDGTLAGLRRVIGLFTSLVYLEQASRTPLLRRKLQAILEAEGLIEGSHDYKATVAAFESFPRDELFQAPVEALRAEIVAAARAEEAQRVTLTERRDAASRNITVMVAMPGDRMSTELRIRLQNLLAARYGAESVEYHLALVEGAAAQLFFLLHIPERGRARGRSRRAGEGGRAPGAHLGRPPDRRAGRAPRRRRGRRLAAIYCPRLPDYYKTATSPELALVDIELLERVAAGEPFAVGLQNELPSHTQAGARPFTRVTLATLGGKIPLGELLPVLEALGLTVMEEVPTRLDGGDDGAYLHDFGVLVDDEQLDCERDGERLAEAITAVWSGRCESDTLNALVVRAGLPATTWSSCAPTGATGASLRRHSPPRTRTTCSAPTRRRRGCSWSCSARASARARRGARGRVARIAGRAARGGRQPRRGSHPARLPGADRRHRAHERRARAQLPLVQAALPRRAAHAGARAALRDFRLPPAGRGHPPARRTRGARRHPLVGPPRGLPLRGAGPDEGADGQERRDRARRRQGRLRAAQSAERARRAARGGAAALLDADPRHARRDRQHRRRRGRRPGGRARVRRGRSVPRRCRRQGHRRALGHRQRDRHRVRLLARRCVRLGRLQGVRPQGARHHGARCLGERQAALPRARPRRRRAPVHGRRHRRHVGRRVRQRHAALAPDPARRGVRPPARVPRPVARSGRLVRRARAALRARGRHVVDGLRPRR